MHTGFIIFIFYFFNMKGVFRGHEAQYLGGFFVNLGISFAFHAELLGVMNAIEIAHGKGW
jgi:hypothetical protein